MPDGERAARAGGPGRHVPLPVGRMHHGLHARDGVRGRRDATKLPGLQAVPGATEPHAGVPDKGANISRWDKVSDDVSHDEISNRVSFQLPYPVAYPGSNDARHPDSEEPDKVSDAFSDSLPDLLTFKSSHESSHENTDA